MIFFLRHRIFLFGISIFVFFQLFTRHVISQDIDKIELYTEYCASCHGEKGQGDGKLAYLLFPKPRDFTEKLFKLKSTPSGSVPSHDDLFKTIQRGMPGTAMPSFYFLKDEEVRALTDYIRELGNFQNESVQSLIIPEPLPFSEELLTKGQQVYKDLKCMMCHGESGIGDGPSAEKLKDQKGFPIQVRDFTQGIYLGGGELKDLYLRFATGLDGTPMPSYLDTLGALAETDEEKQKAIWGLIYYIKSLETKKTDPEKPAVPEDGLVLSHQVSDSLSKLDLENSLHGAWKNAPSYSIPISRLWQTDQTNLSFIQIRSMFNKQYVAVSLEWTDETEDATTYRIQDFQDAAAVQFSIDGKMGFHGMGSKTHAANIWSWKAEFQIRENQNAPIDSQLDYPNRASDAAIATYPDTINETHFLSGRDVNNILSSESVQTSVENANAIGPETLTSQPLSAQNVSGKGLWQANKWKVIFVRERETDNSTDIQFVNKEFFPIALAVWDGKKKDRNGQKMVSTWYKLKLQEA